MSFGLMFWIMMFLWLVFGLVWSFRGEALGGWGIHGHGLFGFILFLLLGWKVFGAPIHP